MLFLFTFHLFWGEKLQKWFRYEICTFPYFHLWPGQALYRLARWDLSGLFICSICSISIINVFLRRMLIISLTSTLFWFMQFNITWKICTNFIHPHTFSLLTQYSKVSAPLGTTLDTAVHILINIYTDHHICWWFCFVLTCL